MAHKTLISGTAYSVTGGRELIDGTGYGCKAGKPLIGGTAFTVPFSKGIPLNTITPGAILYLNESGSPVPFYVAKHDYESELNGTGRTLIVKDGYYGGTTKFGSDSSGNSYASSIASEKAEIYASSVVDERIRGEIRTIKIPITNENDETTTMSAKGFILSMTELGFAASPTIYNVEGTALPYAFNLRKAEQWTRTPRIKTPIEVCYVRSDRNASIVPYFETNHIVPAFTIPATLIVTANPDGTYTIAA